MTAYPSKVKIVEYWDRYFDSCTKEQWLSYPRAMTIDIGEPRCWACGLYDPIMLEPDTPYTYSHSTAMSLWKKSTIFERHHIIPKSRGGSNDVSNFVLLCKLCHIEAPHSTNPLHFWEWARKREDDKANRIIAIVKDYQVKMEITDSEIFEAIRLYETNKRFKTAVQLRRHEEWALNLYQSLETICRESFFSLFDEYLKNWRNI